jgi:hypothetical protein
MPSLLLADAAAPVAGAISTMFFFYAPANAFLDAARVRLREITVKKLRHRILGDVPQIP